MRERDEKEKPIFFRFSRLAFLCATHGASVVYMHDVDVEYTLELNTVDVRAASCCSIQPYGWKNKIYIHK